MRKSFVILLAAIALLVGCKGKSEQKAMNMEQIYKQDGVPVVVKAVAPEVFIKNLKSTVQLTGLEEAVVHSMIGERVLKVYCSPGMVVKKDQLILEFPSTAPGSQYRQAQAAFENSKSTYERLKNLYQSGGISKQDLDNAETMYKVSQANFEATEAMLKVKAPISGMITDVKVKPTDYVNSGDPLFTMGQYSQMKAKVWVTDDDIGYIKKNSKVVLRWMDKEYPARVETVAMAMDEKRQAFAVDIVVNNSQSELKGGLTVEANIELMNRPNAVIIDKAYIRTGNAENFVYVIAGGKALKQKVELGEIADNRIEIKSGLKAGDQLIIEGIDMISDGSKVKIVRTEK